MLLPGRAATHIRIGKVLREVRVRCVQAVQGGSVGCRGLFRQQGVRTARKPQIAYRAQGRFCRVAPAASRHVERSAPCPHRTRASCLQRCASILSGLRRKAHAYLYLSIYAFVYLFTYICVLYTFMLFTCLFTCSRSAQLGFFCEAGPMQIFVSNYVRAPLLPRAVRNARFPVLLRRFPFRSALASASRSACNDASSLPPACSSHPASRTCCAAALQRSQRLPLPCTQAGSRGPDLPHRCDRLHARACDGQCSGRRMRWRGCVLHPAPESEEKAPSEPEPHPAARVAADFGGHHLQCRRRAVLPVRRRRRADPHCGPPFADLHCGPLT